MQSGKVHSRARIQKHKIVTVHFAKWNCEWEIRYWIGIFFCTSILSSFFQSEMYSRMYATANATKKINWWIIPLERINQFNWKKYHYHEKCQFKHFRIQIFSLFFLFWINWKFCWLCHSGAPNILHLNRIRTQCKRKY